MAAKLLRFLELTNGDMGLTVEIRDDGTVSLGIEDKYGGAYSKGSWESIELSAEQAEQLRGVIAG